MTEEHFIAEFENGIALPHVLQSLIDAAPDKSSIVAHLVESALAAPDLYGCSGPIQAVRVRMNRLRIGDMVLAISNSKRPRASTRHVLVLSTRARTSAVAASVFIGQMIMLKTVGSRVAERQWLKTAITKVGR